MHYYSSEIKKMRSKKSKTETHKTINRLHKRIMKNEKDVTACTVKCVRKIELTASVTNGDK